MIEIEADRLNNRADFYDLSYIGLSSYHPVTTLFLEGVNSGFLKHPLTRELFM